MPEGRWDTASSEKQPRRARWCQGCLAAGMHPQEREGPLNLAPSGWIEEQKEQALVITTGDIYYLQCSWHWVELPRWHLISSQQLPSVPFSTRSFILEMRKLRLREVK